jgi:hypothetical protein
MAAVHPQWPHTLADAIAAEIIRWDSNGLGVNYTFPRNDQDRRVPSTISARE